MVKIFALFLAAVAVACGQSIPSSFTWAGPNNLGSPVPTFSNSSTVCPPYVLNQENCGCCYAFSTAVAVGTSVCAQMVSSGTLSAAQAQEFLLISPQMLMNQKVLASQLDQTTVPNPCNGGLQSTLINTIQSLYESHFSSQLDLSTCASSSAATAAPTATSTADSPLCDQGCMPYTEGNCLEDTDAHLVYLNEDYECSLSSGECICKSFTPASGCSQSSVTPLPLPSNNWFQVSPTLEGADLTTTQGQELVQVWLMTHGPVAIAMAGAGSSDFGTYFTQTLPQSISGGSGAVAGTCSACNGQIDHAVTIVGWQSLGGTPCWMIQNSWGSASGDGDAGFFYVAMNNVGTDAGQFNLVVIAGVEVYNTQTNSPLLPAPTVPASAGTTAAPSGSSAAATAHQSTAAPVTSASLESGSAPVLGNIRQLDKESSRHSEVVKGYVSVLAQRANSTHKLLHVQSVSEQVVRGAVYHVVSFVTNVHTGEIRKSHTVVRPSYTGTTGASWSLVRHRITPLTAADMAALPSSSSSSSNGSSRLGLGLGLGLGLAAAVGLTAFVATKVMRRRNAPVALDEKLLPADQQL